MAKPTAPIKRSKPIVKKATDPRTKKTIWQSTDIPPVDVAVMVAKEVNRQMEYLMAAANEKYPDPIAAFKGGGELPTSHSPSGSILTGRISASVSNVTNTPQEKKRSVLEAHIEQSLSNLYQNRFVFKQLVALNNKLTGNKYEPEFAEPSIDSTNLTENLSVINMHHNDLIHMMDSLLKELAQII